MPGVGLLFGPLLIGVCLNIGLYGILLVQVLYLVICDTLNTVFDIGVIYEPLVFRYGTPRAVERIPVMLYVVGGIATSICSTILFDFSQLEQFKGAVITWLASSAIADICITLSLVLSLVKRRTGHSRTNDAIDRIIRPKLYTNSLLSTLNARGGWYTIAQTRPDDNVLFGPLSWDSSKNSQRRNTVGSNRPDVVELNAAFKSTTTGHGQEDLRETDDDVHPVSVLDMNDTHQSVLDVELNDSIPTLENLV
ncbi:hypothetical protein Clacol_005813 [Clathrus columnatus]|uniref:Uncharacterized protein n=1 Tax=Clathrus columnatus TaxID=1419009 RepID=A0AAV5AFY7_9AGAM|nr:hypothetical protein Clacol_005813 [Clathrus columnatus]